MPDTPSDNRTAAAQTGRTLGRGTWIVLGMLALAALAGLLSVGIHYWQGRRALEFWGPHAARRIASAPRAEIWRLAPAGTTATSTRVGTDSLMDVAERKELTNARGLSNIRHALLNDSTYDWSQGPPQRPGWQFALRFFEGDQEAVVLLDLEGSAAALAGRPSLAVIKPEASAALRAFCLEQFGDKP